MAIVPAGIVSQQQLDEAVQAAFRTVRGVVDFNYTVGEDHTGDPSIFFRVVLSNQSARPENLGAATSEITSTVTDRLRSIENFSLFPYFRFRSKAERDQMKAPEWP